MKQFLVKVNGNTYDVTVDETGCIPASAASAGCKAAPSETQEPVKAQAQKAAPAGAGTKINSPMPGTVLKILVKAGDHVDENQPLVVLEAMKMENDIPSTVSGTVLSIEVNQGDSVESGQTLVVVG